MSILISGDSQLFCCVTRINDNITTSVPDTVSNISNTPSDTSRYSSLTKVNYNNIHIDSPITATFHVNVHSVSGILLGVKTLLWLDLFAVISSAYCRNILTLSSSFLSFKVDSLESISGGSHGKNSRNLFIKSNVKIQHSISSSQFHRPVFPRPSN